MGPDRYHGRDWGHTHMGIEKGQCRKKKNQARGGTKWKLREFNLVLGGGGGGVPRWGEENKS